MKSLSFWIILLAVISIGACSRTVVSRSLAADLILRHEQGRFKRFCDASFLAKALKENNLGASVSDVRARIGDTLGVTLCTFSVEVTGISITSEYTRDVVFTETKSYDQAKLNALFGYVEALYNHLSSQSVKAIASDSPQLFGYYLGIVDPGNGRKYLLDYRSRSEERAREIAKTRKLTINDIWENMPLGLARHQTARDGQVRQARRIARLQLFDDGWRILDISPVAPGDEREDDTLSAIWQRVERQQDSQMDGEMKRLQNLMREHGLQ